MDIWGRFDFKAVLNFTGYAERAQAMDAEFARVGLDGVYRIWQFPCPFDRVLQASVPINRMMHSPGFFNSVIGHYRAVKTAYELGAERCLVVEDDIRFLTDLGQVKEIVDSVPADCDIALFDVLKPVKMSMEDMARHLREDKVNQHWVRFYNLRSAGCYSMTRRGMERWLSGVENPAKGLGGKMRLADQYFNVARIGTDMKLYHATPNVAIQVPVGAGNSNSGYVDLASYYRVIGCKPEEYGG